MEKIKMKIAVPSRSISSLVTMGANLHFQQTCSHGKKTPQGVQCGVFFCQETNWCLSMSGKCTSQKRTGCPEFKKQTSSQVH